MSRSKAKQKPPEPQRSGPPIGRWILMGLGLILLVALAHPEAFLQGKIYGSADTASSDAFTIVGNEALAEGDYPEWNPYLFGGMPTYGSLAYRRWVYPPGEILTWFQTTLGFAPLSWMMAHLLFGGAGMLWLLGRLGLPLPARFVGAAVWLLFPKLIAWGVHGHGSKLVSAMYMPWLTGYVMMALEGRARRAVGPLALLLGLQILRGHVQILYYTLIFIALLALGWLITQLLPRRDDGTGMPLMQRLRTAGPDGLEAPLTRVGWGLVALVVAFMIGAVCLLPVHDYAGVSVRGAAEGGGADYGWATGWSLAPSELGTLLVPSSAGFGKSTYLGEMLFNDYPNTFGFVVLVLLVAAWGMRRRWLMITLVSISLLSVLVAFGRHFPVLYDLLYHHLPYFNKLRIPSMILVLPAFAAAILAACGAGRLLRVEALGAREHKVFLGGVLLLAAALLIGAAGVWESPAKKDLTSMAETRLAMVDARQPGAGDVLERVMLEDVVDATWVMMRSDMTRSGLVLLALALAFAMARRSLVFRGRALGWIMVALIAIELLGTTSRVVHPDRGLKDFAFEPGVGYVLQDARPLITEPRQGLLPSGQDGTYRQLAQILDHERAWPVLSEASHNHGMSAHVRTLGGYHAAKLAAFETIQRHMGDPVASWLAGSHLVWAVNETEQVANQLGIEPQSLAQTAQRLGHLGVMSNPAALHRARLVHGWRSGPDENLTVFLNRLYTDSGLDPAHEVHLDQTPVPAPAPAVGDEPPVEYLVDGMDEVVLKASPTASAVLVLADMMAPGWEVTVDGEPTTILTVDHVLRGVALEAGEHEVRFHYHDPSLRRSLIVTVVGILVALFLLGWRYLPLRKPRSAA